MEQYITDVHKKRFQDVPLIVPIYAGKKKEYYSVEDLISFENLEDFLGEVNDHEASITVKGIDFLNDVFGLKKLSEILFERKWYTSEFKNANEIFEWLKWWEKESVDDFYTRLKKRMHG